RPVSATPHLSPFSLHDALPIFLMPFVLARGGLREIGSRWVALIAFAAIEIAGPWFFLSSAEQRISSALAGLLISAVPLVGVAIADRKSTRLNSSHGSISYAVFC